MKTLNMIILLVSLVFNIILLVFIVISILLIYSLLMIGVETKTMETGIMRMVGISKSGLVSMIGIQSVMFVLPSVVTAFMLSFLAIGACYKYIFS
jgi:ABC-type antimicrobial peptide transport system permease subunit